MTGVSATPPTDRYLALWLPRLSTDRLRRERFGRSWRSGNEASNASGISAQAEAPAPLFNVPLGAGNGHRPPAGRPALGSSTTARETEGPAPLVLYARAGNADRVVAVCETAERRGVVVGQGVAEVRARFPDLEPEPADRDADARLLDAVADWCDRYTPLIALDDTTGLVLDITGCAHLFGGVEAMRDDLLARLHRQGLAAQAAVAAHPGTARALVRHAPAILETGAEEDAVAHLPVAALRLGAEEASQLSRLGLKRVGDLLAVPRAALVRRFGAPLARRLDEATGRVRHPIAPRRPVPLVIHERRLFEPISRSEDVLQLAYHLAERVREALEERGEGARTLELALFRVDGRVERVPVRTGAPIRDPGRIERLLRERLKAVGDDLDAGFGYDLVKLCVLASEPMEARQSDLGGADAEPGALDELVDRLSARLGAGHLFSLASRESHWPERAQYRVAPLAGSPRGFEARPRPVRLFDPPEPVEATAEVPDGPIRQFRWRRAFYRVRRIEGPERIASEWWLHGPAPTPDHGPAGPWDLERAASGMTAKDEESAEHEIESFVGAPDRDYFRIEDEEGRRYWLFRTGTGMEAAPGWFLHGLFA